MVILAIAFVFVLTILILLIPGKNKYEGFSSSPISIENNYDPTIHFIVNKGNEYLPIRDLTINDLTTLSSEDINTFIDLQLNSFFTDNNGTDKIYSLTNNLTNKIINIDNLSNASDDRNPITLILNNLFDKIKNSKSRNYQMKLYDNIITLHDNIINKDATNPGFISILSSKVNAIPSNGIIKKSISENLKELYELSKDYPYISSTTTSTTTTTTTPPPTTTTTPPPTTTTTPPPPTTTTPPPTITTTTPPPTTTTPPPTTTTTTPPPTTTTPPPTTTTPPPTTTTPAKDTCNQYYKYGYGCNKKYSDVGKRCHYEHVNRRCVSLY